MGFLLTGCGYYSLAPGLGYEWHLLGVRQRTPTMVHTSTGPSLPLPGDAHSWLCPLVSLHPGASRWTILRCEVCSSNRPRCTPHTRQGGVRLIQLLLTIKTLALETAISGAFAFNGVA